jgi:hypothetical protein
MGMLDPFLLGELMLIIWGDVGEVWKVTLGEATLFVGEIYFSPFPCLKRLIEVWFLWYFCF